MRYSISELTKEDFMKIFAGIPALLITLVVGHFLGLTSYFAGFFIMMILSSIFESWLDRLAKDKYQKIDAPKYLVNCPPHIQKILDDSTSVKTYKFRPQIPVKL